MMNRLKKMLLSVISLLLSIPISFVIYMVLLESFGFLALVIGIPISICLGIVLGFALINYLSKDGDGAQQRTIDSAIESRKLNTRKHDF